MSDYEFLGHYWLPRTINEWDHRGDDKKITSGEVLMDPTSTALSEYFFSDNPDAARAVSFFANPVGNLIGRAISWIV